MAYNRLGPRRRTRRRSFSCSDELWEEIQNKCDGRISASSFIRNAILKHREGLR